MGKALMKLCRTIVAALVLVASVPGIAVIRAGEPDKIKIGEFIPAATPQPAPEISFTDTSGQPVALSDFKSKFVVVNLWATWCQPCLKEMPSLAALQSRLGSALTVLALSEDRGGADVVAPFVAKLGLDKLKIYLDPKSVASRAFAVQGLPTSFVIDGDGQVLGKVEGEADWDSEQMRAVLGKLLPGSPEMPPDTPKSG
jgi:thiol-disulfide isomerase/thioredoxin